MEGVAAVVGMDGALLMPLVEVEVEENDALITILGVEVVLIPTLGVDVVLIPILGVDVAQSIEVVVVVVVVVRSVVDLGQEVAPK